MAVNVNPMNDYVAMYNLSNGSIDVDNKGRVWRLRYKAGMYKRWKDAKPHIIGSKMGGGYLSVGLYLNSKNYNVLAHRIVWIALHGPIPKGLEINHKNGMKDDNNPSNLEIVTPSENMKHSFKVLNRTRTIGTRNGLAKLTEEDVLEIRDRYKKGNIFQYQIAQIYGIAQSTVGYIINRKTWTHI